HGILLASRYCALLDGVAELGAAAAVATDSAPKGKGPLFQEDDAAALAEQEQKVDLTGGAAASAELAVGTDGGMVDGPDDVVLVNLLTTQQPNHEVRRGTATRPLPP
ncbi:unnamed protein product, partial [Laminaria digitata]